MYKTLLISAAFLGASVLGAAAQSSPSPSPSPSAGSNANISAATHCKDKATGQARLKTAASPGAPAGSTTGAASGSTSGSSGGAAGSAGSSPGTAGSSPSAAATLPVCPYGREQGPGSDAGLFAFLRSRSDPPPISESTSAGPGIKRLN
jgi:hypothetical protein